MVPEWALSARTGDKKGKMWSWAIALSGIVTDGAKMHVPERNVA